MDIFTELGNPDHDAHIFTESNEVMGLLIDNYAELPARVGKFLDRVETEIARFVDDPSVELTELKSAIEAFKRDTEIGRIPEQIDPKRLKSQVTRIRSVGKELDPLLAKLAKLRNRLAFGGNLVRAIIRRPKVYVKDYRDTEAYERTNRNQRTANRALDWVEKILLDLYNLVDQDLNLITLVDTVYLRQHIYESGEVITEKSHRSSKGSSQPGGQIRPLADKDLDGLLPWLLKFNEFNGPFNPDGSDFDRNLLIDDPAGENYAYGYFIGDEIVGFVRSCRRGNGNHITLSFLFVRPDHQGQGIGEELFRFMVTKFDGYEQRLNVLVDNLRAIRLYRKYGFYAVDQQAMEHPYDRSSPDMICYKFLRPASITSDDYDPPLDYSRLPEHLRQDEVHLWRADTGLELIHREPSQAELDRIWHNWERMTDRQKTISDKASRRFFGRSNSRHLADLRAEASSSESYRESSEPGDDDTGKPDATADTDEPTTTANEEPEKSKTPEKESMPKQVDRAEAPKNGVKRKELYLAFIEYAKRINPKNTFGSVFDKDAFKVTYPFVPEEMRYFYRLANPLLCLLEDGFVLFSLADLRKVNTDNPKPDRWLIFAADRSTDPKTQDVYAFNREDKSIYHLDETAIANDETIGQPVGESKIGRIAESFDQYIEYLAGVRVL